MDDRQLLLKFILQTNSNALQILQHQSTPEKIYNSKLKHQRSASEPTSACESEKQMDTLTVKERHKSQESPSKDKSSNQRKAVRKVKTRLFNETEHSKSRSHEISKSSSSLRTESDESKVSAGIERLVISSTPMKNGIKASEYPNLPVSSPVTPHESNSRSNSRVNSYSQISKEYHTERCDTPRLSHRHSTRVSSSEKTVSLGDYIINAQNKTSKKKKYKNYSNESIPDSKDKIDLDISNSEMFPEIGAKRSSSNKEKRRIKPTIIDNIEPKHFNQATGFVNEPFNQMSPLVLEQNLAFKQPNIQPKESSSGFDAERNLLKQERHKLMEKFNILNTSSDSLKTPFTPQIKITRKDSKRNNKI
ncbi:hypothetical protein EVAR_58222_1 [Eumeta japonica]|uniref:Uncharacterized protein n=1 Tax=Eumeta variegata TaxID=151549 RepID=A0A4C1ZQD8_EUMVA|nr:hypothetical protein EVAR_58222_1 [Eumeta japonica]